MKPARRLWAAILALVVLAAIVLLVILATAPARIVDSDQVSYGSELATNLLPGQTAGQTFVARHGGLAGIEFLLQPEAASPVTLTLHLRAGPESGVDIASSALHLQPLARPGYYRFVLQPQARSNGLYYYAFLEASAPGVTLPLAAGESYLQGAAYQSHEPLDAQSAFRLVYATGGVLSAFVGTIVGWSGLLAVTLFLFVVPGWALLAWLLPGRRLGWAERLSLAAGIGLALYPLLVLWSHLLGLNLGPAYAWLPGSAGLVALIWRHRRWRPRQGWETFRQWLRSDAIWPDLTLVAVLGLVLGTRLRVVGALEAPLWGDGYQHTLIAQLIADHGGLFRSWAPYAEMTTFTYHFGFHTTVAAFHWLTRLPATASTVWTSQIVNALAVLALVPLAVRVTGSRWGGVWAVLLAGLLGPMPMSYTNWGRFTQLAGLAILPAAVWLTWEAIDSGERRWRLIALVALVVGGLALTHYRILLFYGAFVLGLLLLTLRRHTWRETLLRLSIASIAAGLLFAPWFANTFGGNILRIFGYQITTPPAQSSSFDVQYNLVGDLTTYLAPAWWLAMLVGLGVGLWKRQRAVLLMALWWFLLLIGTNPAWLSLPGSGAITNFALFISVYVPASLFTGWLVVQLPGPLARRRGSAVLVGVLLVLLGVWGARERLGDLDMARGALVTRPDARAAAWIRDNTPAEARFLVNSRPAFGDSVEVGTDGGWWLPLLAGRTNTVPPLNYGSELGPDPEYRLRVNELAQQVRARAPDDPAVLALLKEQGVTYVYIGQRQGRVNYDGPDVLDPQTLLLSVHYRPVYHQDRVWVFQVHP